MTKPDPGLPAIISDEHVHAVGLLIIWSAKLELALTEVIAAFTELSTVDALMVVHHQGVAGKIDTLKAIINLYAKEAPDFPDAIDALNRAKEVTDYRGSLAHAAWHVDDAGITHSVRFTARGELKRSKRAVEANEIRAKALEAARLVERLEGVRDSVSERLEAHRQKK